MRPRHQVGILILILALVLSAGCQFRKAVLVPPQPTPKAPIRDRYAILINMDGSRPQELRRWVEDGSLPNIRRLFFEQGVVFENAINVFPTVSLPNHQAFISGLQPGHHGIPALDWFSRPLERYIDYLRP